MVQSRRVAPASKARGIVRAAAAATSIGQAAGAGLGSAAFGLIGIGVAGLFLGSAAWPLRAPANAASA